jgi:hypothetical protein
MAERKKHKLYKQEQQNQPAPPLVSLEVSQTFFRALQAANDRLPAFDKTALQQFRSPNCSAARPLSKTTSDDDDSDDKNDEEEKKIHDYAPQSKCTVSFNAATVTKEEEATGCAAKSPLQTIVCGPQIGFGSECIVALTPQFDRLCIKLLKQPVLRSLAERAKRISDGCANLEQTIECISLPPSFVASQHQESLVVATLSRRYLYCLQDHNFAACKISTDVLIRDITSALNYLHVSTGGLAHGDVKPENIFAQAMDPKSPHRQSFVLGDLSTILEDEKHYTQDYSAPPKALLDKKFGGDACVGSTTSSSNSSTDEHMDYCSGGEQQTKAPKYGDHKSSDFWALALTSMQTSEEFSLAALDILEEAWEDLPARDYAVGSHLNRVLVNFFCKIGSPKAERIVTTLPTKTKKGPENIAHTYNCCRQLGSDLIASFCAKYGDHVSLLEQTLQSFEKMADLDYANICARAKFPRKSPRILSANKQSADFC